MTCDRCQKETSSSTMSWFNTQVICLQCSEDEKSNPNYDLAKKVELEHVLKGNFNYSGLFAIPDEDLHEKIYP